MDPVTGNSMYVKVTTVQNCACSPMLTLLHVPLWQWPHSCLATCELEEGGEAWLLVRLDTPLQEKAEVHQQFVLRI